MPASRGRATRSQGEAIDMVTDPEAALRSTKKTTAGKSSSMLTQLPRGGQHARLIRPVPFEPVDDKPLSTGQINGNLINAQGMPRPRACLPCLTAIRFFKPSFTVGRGATKNNELFGCLVWVGRGKDGTQCGRCVGQGGGPKCLDPPKGLEEEVHSLLRLLPEYNRILDANRDVEGNELDEDDLAKVMEAVKASDLLFRRATGSEALRTQRDLKRKRSSSDLSSPSKELKTLSYSSIDIRGVIDKVELMTRTLSGFCRRDMFRKLERLETLLQISRERQRWQEQAFHLLIDAHNNLVRQQSADGGLPGPEHLLDLPAFNAQEIVGYQTDSAFSETEGEVEEGMEEGES